MKGRPFCLVSIMPGTVGLFTDFGLKDPYVGQLHAIISHCNPSARVIDLEHYAPAFHPEVGGLLLEALVPYLPEGMVVVGVVDPGVGTNRRPIALEVGGQWFVGPDNGLFSPVMANADRKICSIEAPLCAPGTLSASFHGRDLFAPAAAVLAQGDLSVLGPRISDPVRCGGEMRESVVYVDHYGNLMTGSPCRQGAMADRMIHMAGVGIPPARTFADVKPGELFWYCNSLQRVEVAAREASAQDILGVGCGTPLHWSFGD